MQERFIQALEGQLYLGEVLASSGGLLPQNCLFDKVLTGAGGTYVALTAPEPYIIAVPTKALVEDKIKSPQYAHVKLLAVSGDYDYVDHAGVSHKGVPPGYDKIICTYQQLENVASKINPKGWHLLVDEMHMILRLATFCPAELSYMISHFRDFKSYCFMSATVPKEEHLIPELKSLDRVKMVWPKVTPIAFKGYKATSVKESVIQVALEHLDGIRPGNAYFFYNSVAGICNVLKQLKKVPEAKNSTRVIAAKSSKTSTKVAKEGFSVTGSSDPHGKINFITSAAFEGADFMDEEGVTYIVTEDQYEHTKYSVTTAIPQIVGRLRKSIYNGTVHVIFDSCTLLDARTPEEFLRYVEGREKTAKGTVDTFQFVKGRDDTGEVLPGIIEAASRTIYNFTKGLNMPIEEVVGGIERADIEGRISSIEVLFNEYARYVDLEYYDTIQNQQMLVTTTDRKPPVEGSSSLKGILQSAVLAPSLSPANRLRLKSAKSPSVKSLLEMYQEDPMALKGLDPDFYEWVSVLGVDKVMSCGGKRTLIKTYYEKKIKTSSYVSKKQFRWHIKAGESYTSEELLAKVQEKFHIPVQTSAEALKLIRKYCELKPTSKKGCKAYRVVRHL